MEQTKKWYQSNTVRAAIALVVVSLGFLGVSFNLFDQAQLESATTAYPEIQNGIELIKGGQIFAGVGAIAGALVIYFRITAKKLIG